MLRSCKDYLARLLWPENDAPVPMSMHLMASNDLIVQEISQYLSNSDLKSLRRVCYRWDFFFHPQLIRNSSVTIKTLEKMEEYTQDFEELTHSYMKISVNPSNHQVIPGDFLPFFQTIGGRLSKLQFLIMLNANNEENHYSWVQLLGSLTNLVELQLDIYFYSLLPMDQLDLNEVPILPNLRKLTIGIERRPVVNEDFINEVNEVTLTATVMRAWGAVVGRMCPNIHSMGVKNMLYYPFNVPSCFYIGLDFERFTMIQNMELTLDNLSLTPRALLRRLPPLVKLILGFTPEFSLLVTNQTWEGFSTLLEGQADTLEELRMIVPPALEIGDEHLYKFGLRFPQMPRLRVLQVLFLKPKHSLWFLTSSRIDFQFDVPPVNFTVMFPVLERLTVKSKLFPVQQVMLRPEVPCLTLRSLIIGENEGKDLQRHFPNAEIRVEPCSKDKSLWVI